ncbi:hypothetical protein [Kitasatospora sp. NBC_01300]|uniref:hypothetical protein n=1 Tax=Kitasatospora sp. NBC_01300 TaxID=2903574 RepID=UPI002F90CD8F|nr:hypothetical protein OG556_40425 [Kitasatospora sp. NBC_01300]
MTWPEATYGPCGEVLTRAAPSPRGDGRLGCRELKAGEGNRPGRREQAGAVEPHPQRVGGGTVGVIRPCPALAARCPDLHGERIFVRNATEAHLLVEAGLDRARITDLGLPDFEQDTLC